MEFEDQPRALARGRSTTTDNLALLADKLSGVDPRINHLLTEVLQQLQQQEEEISRLQCISQQRQRDIQRQDVEIQKLREEVALERAYDRQRISKLEAPAPALREKTAEDHLNRLFSEMRRLSIRQTTVRDAARFIGISKPHMQKLKPYLAADMRFTLLKDPRRSNRYLIRIV